MLSSYPYDNKRMAAILMNKPSFYLALLSVMALTACGSTDMVADKVTTVVSPYRMDIVQGNVVTREQVALIKPGMPRALVRDILGTSLLVSVFHATRWDYVFTLERQGAESQTRRVTVFFNNDVVERIESDTLPTEADFAATLQSKPIKGALPLLEAAPDKLRQPPATPPAAMAPAATLALPPTVYPPLESVSP
jgi:outer membrane protein assembly factor BamE